MAVDAFFLHGRMDEFLPLKRLELIGMTLETYVVSGCAEEFGKVRLVGVMAHSTTADRHRAMDEFAGHDFFIVAEKTEGGPFCAELVFIRRLVRIVAFRAVSFLYRSVDRIFRIHLVVALVTIFLDACDA